MKIKTTLIVSSLLICACTNLEKPSQPVGVVQNRGKKVAFTFELGNCLACHVIAEGDSPGNIGPELKNLPQRFKDKMQLQQFIWDATAFNPNTSMPPFGKNKILTEEDISQLVDYLWEIK
jgi:sulfur-oxidizing protein SoxX